MTTLQTLTVLAIAPMCLAGIQYALPIINRSPWSVNVDMTDAYESNCMKSGATLKWVESYMDSWKSISLRRDFGREYADYDVYLQYFKANYELPDLGQGDTLQNGQATIDPYVANSVSAPFLVIEGETDGGLFSGCIGSHSYQAFGVTINGTTTKYTLKIRQKTTGL
ncbi:uncharacterized protein AB675_10572 [Cyphellophora attinorum]|uniref:Uncharacterized protein n=1 Tax=Cyphellophora attinorum TaxID=1664694 RepID=A0A0N1HUT1_9EURO|nr:uncharacterized protein AB675_10572 [Phialophora attinorum]KPI40816.1 hypothetical protein AB675_10572 [Phialophora attinorum]